MKFGFNMGLSICLIFNAIIFCMSILAIILNRNNYLILFILIQLMLLAVNTNFIAYAKLWGDYNGKIFVLIILAISAIQVILAANILLKFLKKTNRITGAD